MQKKIMLISVLLLLFFSGQAQDRDSIRIDLSGTYMSRFVWRGDIWTDAPVFWFMATFRYKGFRLFNFFNIDLTDINGDQFKINEFDFILDYTFSFNSFSVAPGVLHFSSPTGFFESSTKITLQIKTKILLKPGLRIRVDPINSEGSYYILDVSHRFSPKKIIKHIDLNGSLGVSQPRYYGKGLKEEIAFTDILLGIRIPFKLGKCMTLTPLAEFTALLGQHLRKGIEARGRKTSAFTYGITLSRKFEF